ncbi:MAG TPA: FAD-binding oxidoreductase [Chloroflexota bacterium]|nr:FAD-binding oxidoreductase [Chloroflexota bacterium]
MIDTSSAAIAPQVALGCATSPPAQEPPDAATCAALLREAATAGNAVVPWGGGTQQQLGAPPARCDLLLSTRRLSGVDFYRPEDLTIGVRAGTTLAEVASLLAAHGQSLPLDAPCPEAATIGGIVATATSPVRRYRYGTVRDLVIGVEVALVDGSLCKAGGRVVKNVAGYDLCKLFAGSLGTLGVIVGVNLKVQPRPRVEATVHVAFEREDAALAAGRAVTQSGLGHGAVLVEGQPGKASWTLTVLAEGFSGAVDRQVEVAERAASAAHSKAILHPGAESSQAAVNALAARRSLQPDQGTVLVRGSVAPAHLATVLQQLPPVLEPSYRVTYVQADVPLGIFFLELDPGTETSDLACAAVLRQARSVVQHESGHLVLEAGPTSLRRTLDPWGAPPDGEGLARLIKRKLDPAGILNPGRFAYGI